jgi:hydrogenase/urease accessory protein HupE
MAQPDSVRCRRLPDGCHTIGEPTSSQAAGAFIAHGRVHRDHGLAGQLITIDRLEATLTDVLVRIESADGGVRSALLTPSNTSIIVPEQPGLLTSMRTYFWLGVEHILLGVDHLLFVLGLLLLVRNLSMLLKTITAFTIAHSITLTAATLGYIHIAAPPLNAAIALSIMFVGIEVVRARRGETTLASRNPWAVAFIFGLLHGVGFASGLIDLGLSAGDIPIALLFFNIGVESGQLLFVVVILLLARAFRILEIRWPRLVEEIPVYAVGSLGAYWTIDRLVAMWSAM